MSVDLVGFLGVVMLAYLVPGPDFLVIVRAAARRTSLGRAAAFGAQTGLCVHMCAAALGLSAIAAQSALAFTVIKLAGAAYLVHLGVRALLAARKDTEHGGGHGAAGREEAPGRCSSDGAAAGERGHSRRASFAEGFLSNVLNPKAALFFLSILPQFVNQGGSPARQIFLLGALDVLIGVVYWLALVGFAARLRTALARPSWRRRWERISGSLFIALGITVATAE
ncbi:LysE family translocator [Streptomyces sp. NRRL S-920]|uniref:LysE family translocator n=1 Tax=Streptomyces sp. NRRL S-920 TaxID=1463921 RepID=UPI0004CB5338|nr:LysE family translocator [Streptomyces sp. NRRL S-920]